MICLVLGIVAYADVEIFWSILDFEPWRILKFLTDEAWCKLKGDLTLK